jgi:UDP-N-acetylglucosamine 1-carboxyvinyltransferase
MDTMKIRGGNRLNGTIRIGGAKNAALNAMPVVLLTDETVTFGNLPHVADITTMINLLAQHGAAVAMNGATEGDGHLGRVIEFTTKTITSTTAPYDIVRKMRAGVWVLGPLLARCGKAEVSLPGGCAIGTRPVDLHLNAMKALGAEIELVNGYIEAKAPRGLHGARIVFPTISVGATENAMMAASLAKGETVLLNAAREPEVIEVAECLQAMGAHITGAGTDTIHIQGRDSLHGMRHDVIPDRIEAGTFMMAALITDGDVILEGMRLDHLDAVSQVLRQAGGLIEAVAGGGVRVRRAGGMLRGVDITTEPFPGFPTDLQAQFMALMTVATGAARIDETIFENRFMHVPELLRMGADISVHGGVAVVRGVPQLHGAAVMATDLRASVSLVLAGMVADGETTLHRLYHLDRGYERLEEKLSACGADIKRVRESAPADAG